MGKKLPLSEMGGQPNRGSTQSWDSRISHHKRGLGQPWHPDRCRPNWSLKCCFPVLPTLKMSVANVLKGHHFHERDAN